MNRYAQHWRYGLGAFLPVDESRQSWTVPAGGSFSLRLSLPNTFPTPLHAGAFLQKLFLGLSNIDGLSINSQNNVTLAGPIVTITGQANQAMSAHNLTGRILDVVDDYTQFDGSSVFLQAELNEPVDRSGNVSTREPIVDREPEAPRILEPDPAPTGSGPSGSDGSGGNTDSSDDLPVTLPAVVGSDGKIFGIEPKFLLIGGIALFFLMRGK